MVCANEEHCVPVVGHEVGLQLLQGVERELGPPDDLLGHVGRPGQQKMIICLPNTPKPVFLNVYGAQESIPRNQSHQPM